MRPKMTVDFKGAVCRLCGSEIKGGSVCAGLGNMRFCTMREAMLFEAVAKEAKKDVSNQLALALVQELGL